MSATQKILAIILAAGKGTRMKSDRPKVMHHVAGLSMIGHALKTCHAAGADAVCVVTSPSQDDVRAHIAELEPELDADVMTAIQQHQRGTGDAVKSVQIDSHFDKILIMFGDTPLMRPETLQSLAASDADVTVLGFRPHNPAGYGRIILHDNKPVRIIEHKDADEATRQIDLCNGGAMAVRAGILDSLTAHLSDDNAQGEFYLPDLVALAVADTLSTALVEGDAEDTLGVDSRAGLAKAEALMQQRLRQAHLANGVTLQDAGSVYFSHDTQIAPDVVIEPHCIFGPAVQIAGHATIKGFSHLEGVTVGAGAQIGPYARLRPGTDVGANAKIGNFVETKKARIGEGAKVNHLSYIGDALVGPDANIGAGTITCNYDGFDKHVTEIGAGAFIGSNTSLIAPVIIGEGAYIGSSSAISNDVGDDNLALTRAPLREIKNWATKFRTKKKGK